MSADKTRLFEIYFLECEADLTTFAEHAGQPLPSEPWSALHDRITKGLWQAAESYEWQDDDYQTYLPIGPVPDIDGTLGRLVSTSQMHLHAQTGDTKTNRRKVSHAGAQKRYLSDPECADPDMFLICFGEALYLTLLAVVDDQADQVDLISRASTYCALGYALYAQHGIDLALQDRYIKKHEVGLMRTDRVLDHDDAQRALLHSSVTELIEDEPGISQNKVEADIVTAWLDSDDFDASIQSIAPDKDISSFKAPATSVREWVREIYNEIKG
jgi:hypothetical protein